MTIQICLSQTGSPLEPAALRWTLLRPGSTHRNPAVSCAKVPLISLMTGEVSARTSCHSTGSIRGEFLCSRQTTHTSDPASRLLRAATPSRTALR